MVPIKMFVEMFIEGRVDIVSSIRGSCFGRWLVWK